MFDRLREKLQNFMSGRNGVDSLAQTMTFASLALLLISIPIRMPLLSFIAYGLFIYAYFRVFSKNVSKRQEENRRFLAWWEHIRFRFQSGKVRMGMHRTHVYFKCRGCGKKLRVPRGKGRIEITCPNCGAKCVKKT